MGKSKQNLKEKKQQKFEGDSQSPDDQQEYSGQQGSQKIQQLSGSQKGDQQQDESQPIQAAIKSMKFREKRGSRMKDLMKGKIDKDQFWEKNKVYFGGDLKGKDQDQHESQYQASSSGRDQFDSDFDLTDSYPGKRGRKKGQKVKRKVNRNEPGRSRGRPKKVKEQSPQEQSQQSSSQKKIQIIQKKKKIYKQVPSKPHDAFVIYICLSQKKKQYSGAKQQKKLELQEKPEMIKQEKNNEQCGQE